MKRKFLKIVLFLAVALVTTMIVFTAPAHAQGRWVLMDGYPVVNEFNYPLEFYGGEGVRQAGMMNRDITESSGY